MSATADLQHATSQLVCAIKNDPTLSLALAATWLDPLHFLDSSLYDLAGGEEDPDNQTFFALEVARTRSLSLYTELVQGLYSGWGFADFDQAFCTGFQHKFPHIPLSGITDMLYDVPLEFCGLEPTEPGFADRCPDLAAVLNQYFQVLLTDGAISGADFEATTRIAEPVIRSLINQDCQPYADLALTLLYLFALTGNTALDYTSDAYCEGGFEPLYWAEPGQLEMANEANHEVWIVREAAARTLKLLDERPDIAEALTSNVAACRAALLEERTNIHDLCHWPSHGRSHRAPQGARRGTDRHAALLFVRNSYAAED